MNEVHGVAHPPDDGNQGDLEQALHPERIEGGEKEHSAKQRPGYSGLETLVNGSTKEEAAEGGPRQEVQEALPIP